MASVAARLPPYEDQDSILFDDYKFIHKLEIGRVELYGSARESEGTPAIVGFLSFGVPLAVSRLGSLGRPHLQCFQALQRDSRLLGTRWNGPARTIPRKAAGEGTRLGCDARRCGRVGLVLLS